MVLNLLLHTQLEVLAVHKVGGFDYRYAVWQKAETESTIAECGTRDAV